MNSIGGYFELEMPKKQEYHADAIKLNSARNCLELFLRSKKFDIVFLPYYTCEAILEPFKKLTVKYEFYKIDNNFEIINLNKYLDHGLLLYTNYYGIKKKYVTYLSQQYKNIIIDNAQAFFMRPEKDIPAFYSCRKFFGVPDGGYIYMNDACDIQLEQDTSYERFSHLLKRIDETPQHGYQDFVNNNQSISNQPIKKMSKLTQGILSSIDYEKAKIIRERNFLFLHDLLREYNELKIDLESVCGPMIYPYLKKNDNLHQNLIGKQIYVATYWKNVLEWCKPDSIENYMVKYLIPLPIDHRYSLDDMNKLYKILMEML